MSSLRKAAPRREHKERAQPAARAKLGLLEKHKDYVLRSQNFKKKQATLHKLKQKAAFRNKDEFYFGMVNKRTKGGVHIETRNERLDHQTLALLKTQDRNYIKTQQQINAKKIEKMKNGILDPKNEHIIFTDDVDNFDIVEHFDTVPELANRPMNRIRKKDLEAMDFQYEKVNLDQRKYHAVELASRLERDDKLRKALREVEIQKELMGKGARKKIGVDEIGNPVYKWQPRRKR